LREGNRFERSWGRRKIVGHLLGGSQGERGVVKKRKMARAISPLNKGSQGWEGECDRKLVQKLSNWKRGRGKALAANSMGLRSAKMWLGKKRI